MTPIEEAPRGFHKRLSLFNRGSNHSDRVPVANQYLAPYSEDDDMKMDGKRNSLTAGSAISVQELRVNIHSIDWLTNHGDGGRLELQWAQYSI